MRRHFLSIPFGASWSAGVLSAIFKFPSDSSRGEFEGDPLRTALAIYRVAELHSCRALVGAAELTDQREQRQIHGDHDAADHDAQEYDHHGFQSCEQVLDRRVNFVLIEVGNFL